MGPSLTTKFESPNFLRMEDQREGGRSRIRQRWRITVSFGQAVFLNPECAGWSLVDLGYIAKLLANGLARLTILF
jgi:hypothetical protein